MHIYIIFITDKFLLFSLPFLLLTLPSPSSSLRGTVGNLEILCTSNKRLLLLEGLEILFWMARGNFLSTGHRNKFLFNSRDSNLKNYIPVNK